VWGRHISLQAAGPRSANATNSTTTSPIPHGPTRAPPQDVKARSVGAAVWGALATAGFFALGGFRGYWTSRYYLTLGGAAESNLTWVLARVGFGFEECLNGAGGGGGADPPLVEPVLTQHRNNRRQTRSFVWLLLLGYFAFKGAVMTAATAAGAHAFERQRPAASKVRARGAVCSIRAVRDRGTLKAAV
jgi:hypothetical protein